MLKNIYCKKRLGIPWIAFLLFITCSIVSIPTYFNKELFQIFSASTQPIYFWQYFSGNFEHSISPIWFFWAHYLGNMSVIVLFGVFIERVIGSKKMFQLTLTAGIIHSISFQIFSHGYCTGSGVSGVVWSYAPIALYIIVQIYSYKKKKIFTEPLIYLMIFEFIFIWIFITAASKWDGTNRSHLISSIVGIVFLLFNRKSIKKHINTIYSQTCNLPIGNTSGDRLAIGLFSILPVFMLIILALYQGGKLDKLYVDVVSISPCSTFNDIAANDNKIEITFEEPVEQVASTYTETQGEAVIIPNINYSEDRKTVILTFDQTQLKESKIMIILREIIFNGGRRAKPIRIELN